MANETWVENCDRPVWRFDFFGEDGGIAFAECQFAFIHGQTVKSGSVERGKTLELVQRAFFLKNMRQKAYRVGGCKAPCAAAGRFLPQKHAPKGLSCWWL